MQKYFYLLCLLGMLLVAGCMKKNSTSLNCTYDPCELKAPDSEVKALKSYLDTNHITAVQHCSGLFYQIVNPGEGSSPSICSAVSVTYKGSLTNGNVFDQSASPVAFSLNMLIEGWKKGLILLKKGGSMKLYVPPSLGYGASANGSIPANSILIFDISLVDLR